MSISANPMIRVLRDRNFRLLVIGQGTSLLGDQFSLIALPWLALQLTGSGLALGTVLALGGIPRALFMLVGGAITDRFSARTIMLASDLARMVMTGALAAQVLTGSVEMWTLYVYALAFGIVDGFFMPATSSIVPQIVDSEDLEAGNAITQGTMQLSVFVGPVLAGALIASFAGRPLGSASIPSTTIPEMGGLGLAFAIDAVTFGVSTVTLWLMRVGKPAVAGAEAQHNGHIVESIVEALHYVWRDPILRVMFLLVATINFLLVGPFFVGVPVLADTRLPEGAAAFGIVMSAWGVGSLLGYTLVGTMPRVRSFGVLISTAFVLSGLGLASLGFIGSTAIAALTVAVMGIGDGYVSILLITWLQRRTPPAMLGRVMSLVMFASMGLIPVSQALSGALIGLSLVGLFVGAGILLVLVAMRAVLLPEVRSFKLDLDGDAIFPPQGKTAYDLDTI